MAPRLLTAHIRIIQAAVPKLLLLLAEAKPPALLGFVMMSVILQVITLGKGSCVCAAEPVLVPLSGLSYSFMCTSLAREPSILSVNRV